ncbi:DinB family protein [Cohnella sp. JJ-181]|uniref:DinB family protein n=1 Tax=Cohnella rhizoplanae TaxID=2974897 RepID=UPI0022FFA23A|nr:DinB family protein [Cohnella sp. JJ-181]CAI6083188.1 hypothetical protein COHCIP112018_03902 [Cohnella sp. JJ-181]
MYQTIEQFVNDWNQEAALTLKVLEALTDASLKQSVSDTRPRSIGDLGWHVAGAPAGILGSAGLRIEGPDFKRPVPASAAEIAEAYRSMSVAVANAIKAQWADARLSESLLLFGSMNMTYNDVLNLVVRHQIHHRAQMTVLMRQAGVVPPGVYGPNEEEGAAIRAARSQQ